MATRSLAVRPLTSKEHETFKHLVKVIPAIPVDGHSPTEVLKYLIQKFGGNRAHIEEQINAWFDGKLNLEEETWTTFSSKKPEVGRRHFAGQRGERGDKDRQRPARGSAPKGKGAERPKRHEMAEAEKQKAAEESEASEPATPEQPKRETWASRLRKVLETEAVAVATVGEEEVVEATTVEPEAQPEEKVEQEAGEPVVSDPRVVKGVWGNKAGLSNVKSSKPVVKKPVETPEKVADAQPEEETVEDVQPEAVAEPETQEPEEEPKEEEKPEVVEPAVVEPAVTTKRGIHFGRSVKEQSKGKFKFGAAAAGTEGAKTKHMTGGELDKYVLDSIQNAATEEAPAPAAKQSKPKREHRQKERKEAAATEAAAPVASEEAPKETEKAENTPVVPSPPPVPPTNTFAPNMYGQIPQLPNWMMNNPMFLSMMYQMLSGNQMMQPGMTAGGAFPNAATMSNDFQSYVSNPQVTGDGPGASTHGMGDFSNNPGFNNMAPNFGQAGFNAMPGHMSSMPYNNFGQTETGSNKGNFPQGTQQQNRQWSSSQNTFPSGNAPYSFNANVGSQTQHSGQPGQFGSGNYSQFQYPFDKGYYDKNNQSSNAPAPGLKQNNASQGTYSYGSVSSYNAGGASQSPNFNNTQSETPGHLNSVPYNYTSSYSSPGQNYFRQN